MTSEEFLKNWHDESEAANNAIIEILESYMDFVDIFEKTISNKAFGTEKILVAKPYMQLLIEKTRRNWRPILETAKKTQKLGVELEQITKTGGKK